MKILYVTDLHGATAKYERVLQVAQLAGVDAVVNGGDMLPKRTDLFQQDRYITGYLHGYFARFDSVGIHCLCYLGNDDLRIFDELFEQVCDQHPCVTCLAQRKITLMGYEFIGMNWVADYPFQLKDRARKDNEGYVFQQQLGPGVLSTTAGWQEIDDWFSYAATLPTIEDELQRLVRPDDMARAVYVLHMPPSQLGLDKCMHGAEVGSDAVYDFLSLNQPLLSLHGHIHESPDVSGYWYRRLGTTTCIQPGQPDDELAYVLVDLETMTYCRVREKPADTAGDVWVEWQRECVGGGEAAVSFLRACPTCRSQNRSKAMFCHICGRSLA